MLSTQTFNFIKNALKRYSDFSTADKLKQPKQNLEKNDLDQELEKLFNANNTPKVKIANQFNKLWAKKENKNNCLGFSTLPEGDCNKLYWEIALVLYNSETLIKKLLNQYTRASNANKNENKTLHDYAQLQTAATSKEFKQELEKLKKLFSNKKLTEEEKKTQFKKLCANREKENENACLSFLASPEGDCNKLYWEIAEILFLPKTLQEMLAVIAPSVTKILTVDAELEEFDIRSLKINREVEIKLKLTEKNFNMENASELEFESKIRLNRMEELVSANGILFDLRGLEKLPFDKHRKLYNLLNKYPELKTKIYNHNKQLKQLLTDIELIEEKGKTPREAIFELISELERAGEKNSRTKFAPDSAGKASEQFFQYFNNLPQTFQENLLSLKNSTLEGHGTTLNDVLFNSLAKGKCVETAASYLREILDTAKNKTVLDTLPHLTSDEIKAINSKYGKDNSLIVAGHDSTVKLPDILRQSLFKQIKITNTYEVVDLLINLPCEDFKQFIQAIKFNSFDIKLRKGIGKAFKDGLLKNEPEKRTTLFNTLIAYYTTHHNKLDDWHSLLEFAVCCNNVNYYEKIWKAVPEKIKPALQKRIMHYSLTHLSLLQLAVKQRAPEVVEKLAGEIPKPPIGSLLAQSTSTDAMLYNDYDTIKALLEGFSPETFLNLNKNGFLLQLLHSAAIEYSNNSIKAILEVVKKRVGVEKLVVLLNSYYKDRTFLMMAASRCRLETVQQILESVLENRTYLLKKGDNFNQSPALHFALHRGNKDIVNELLNNCSCDIERSNLVQIQNRKDQTALHGAALSNNPELINIILNQVPETRRRKFVNQKDRDGNSALDLAIKENKYDSVKEILKTCYGKEFNSKFLLELSNDKSASPENAQFAAIINNKSIFHDWNIEFPEEGLKFLAAKNNLLLTKSYGKFVNLSNEKQNLLDNIKSVINNLLYPRGGIFSLHKNRDFIPEVFGFIRNLNAIKNIDCDKMQKCIIEAYQVAVKEIPAEKFVPLSFSYLKRLAYCYQLVDNARKCELTSLPFYNEESIQQHI